MKRLNALVVLLVVSFSLNAKASILDLSQGTLSLGGSASVTLNTTTDVHALRVAPAFGYFLSDNVELAFSVQYSNDLGSESGSLLGAGIGVLGYLDLGSALLKSGGVFAVYGSFYNGDTATILELTVPLMLVFPLSPGVAVNTGLMVQIFIAPEGGDPMVQLPLGFLGVSAYY